MTRINVVPVEELTDNFLMAEYFELPRIFVLVRKHFENGIASTRLKIPPEYVMGKGHMTFFYNKLEWLLRRQAYLQIEGMERKLTLTMDPDTIGVLLPPRSASEWWGDYIPTPEALQLNRNRLQYRMRYDGGVYQGSR